MKKKISKAGRNRRRQPVKDLTTAKSRGVKGGAIKFNEFVIKKTSDKASPAF